MAHWSENTNQLVLKTTRLETLDSLADFTSEPSDVCLFWLPSDRTQDDAARSQRSFAHLISYCANLPEQAVVCLLTTPADAATLLPRLEGVLRFQLWVAVKTEGLNAPNESDWLSKKHSTLLVLTRYRRSLQHTKTRTQYTYCPACHKTTKDYGGKKHTYHEYGTLLSDIWRDATIDAKQDISLIIERLRDLFGLPPYEVLQLFDLRECAELQPRFAYTASQAQEINAVDLLHSQLLNGDCLEHLRRTPDNSIDFCFADPPYNLQKKYDSCDDALELVKYFEWCDEWLSELYRVLKPGHTLAVLNIPQWAARHYQHLSSFARFQNWLAWDGLSYPVRQIMPSHYGILCMSKGEPRSLPGLAKIVRGKQDAEALAPLAEFYCLRSDCISRRSKLNHNDHDEVSDLWHDVHRLKHNSRRVDHPCQLPPLLMRRLYALFTKPGEIVLDCFNGAGTSTLVAQQMGRRFVGIELSGKYHELATQRHQTLTQGEDPFAKGDTVPQAKNSPLERLPKQKYKVSKKVLQLDVKRIAQHLGRLPSRDEVGNLSRFPLEYFDNYFVSWGEVCAAARTTGMSEMPLDQTSQTAQLTLFAN